MLCFNVRVDFCCLGFCFVLFCYILMSFFVVVLCFALFFAVLCFVLFYSSYINSDLKYDNQAHRSKVSKCKSDVMRYVVDGIVVTVHTMSE